MVNPVKIENLPEEIGEEISIANNDDGTISSKILGSIAGNASPPKNEDTTATIVEVDSKAEKEDDNERDEKEEVEEDSVNETEEREFDKNPTVLYALVQKKLWKETIARTKTNPKEARAYISRREKDGRIRWRLLPLHAAIVFKAPEDVIEALLSSFPKAAESKDDQGMLPLHLAFRNNASEAVVNLLLLANPESVNSPDRKGRVPLTLAKAAASPKRELYIQALEKGPSHYAVTALACARDRIIAEQKEIHEAQIEETRKSHEAEIEKMKIEAEKMKKEIEGAVDEKEKELSKLHDNSQVLVDHVASLEAQMNTRSDTERFLATKIAKLEEKVRTKDAHIEERETFWQLKVSKVEEQATKKEGIQEEEQQEFLDEKTKLNAIVEGLTEDLNETKASLSATQKKLKEANDLAKDKQDDWDMKEIRSDAKLAKIEIDWANSQANVAILESQLKKRMENEHLLANQVSSLATRLAESSDGNLQYSKELKVFEEKNQTLETTIMLLEQRLKNVTEVMESTREQQMSILDDAIAQEETMAKCMESHAQMVSDSLQYEMEMQTAKVEMMELIERSFTEANEKRIERFKTATSHGQFLSSMNTSRHNVLSCAQTVTSNVISALEKDLDLDTLSTEVSKLVIKKKRIREHGGKEFKKSINEEVRDEPEDLKKKENHDESPETTQEVPTAAKEETVEVASSPKKSLNTIALIDNASKFEEEQTEQENIPDTEVPVKCVTAE